MKYVNSVIERLPFINIHNITEIKISDDKDDLYIRFDNIIWRGYAHLNEFNVDKQTVLEAMRW